MGALAYAVTISTLMLIPRGREHTSVHEGRADRVSFVENIRANAQGSVFLPVDTL